MPTLKLPDRTIMMPERAQVLPEGGLYLPKDITRRFPHLREWPLGIPPMAGGSPAVTFMETPEATHAGQFWDTFTGSVTRDTTAARDPKGIGSWKCDSGAGAAAYCSKNITDVYRASYYLYIADLPTSANSFFNIGDAQIVLESSGEITLWTGGTERASGSTLGTATLYRISLAISSSGAKVFVDGTEDISDGTAVTAGTFFRVGWIVSPGASKVMNFSHVYVDDVTDLTDPAGGSGYGLYITAKLPASVNNNQYTLVDSDVVTAVSERPIVEANHMIYTAKAAVYQDYTLEAAAVGDIDISGAGITLIGYSAWMWAKASKDGENFLLVYDGNTQSFASSDDVYTLYSKIVTSASYPSNAAGIGQGHLVDVAVDDYLAECGIMIAYKEETAVQVSDVAAWRSIYTMRNRNPILRR